MEHLVIRTTNFMAPGNRYKMKLYKPGYQSEFTQRRNGSNPLKIDLLQLEDTIWLAESGYGVIARCKIISSPTLHTISNEVDLNKFRESSHPNLQEDENYWIDEKRKIHALKAHQERYIIRIPYEVVDVDFAHFPLNTPINYQQSWTILTEDKKRKYFYYQFNTTVQDYLLDRVRKNKEYKKYTNITLDVRNKIEAIWEGRTYNGKIFEQVNGELDHVVPQSVLGPGLFHENIVPVEGTFNVQITNKIPISFFKALELFDKSLITDILANNYNDYFIRNADFKLQLTEKRPTTIQKMEIHEVIKNIMMNRTQEEQRTFYLGIAILFYGKIVWTKYLMAKNKPGIVLDGIESNMFINEILKMADE